ncbi:protein artichoke-like [Polistes fuscatus]|uniref:protein artichoke-like n=1 Tax=Polistes fuscatus TaxID=30207 RepID=UPI001CA89772|nr:protein artichoke-like [Polistes fuscatus]
MIRPLKLIKSAFIVGWYLILYSVVDINGQIASEYGCPPQERILPCRCSTRDTEIQIWCSHSELAKVLEGLKAVSHYVDRPIDELILENNNLPSLPGKAFATLKVLRLMLRNNRLERVSSGWLEGLHDSLLEIFIVESDLRSLPIDSLENLQGLEAITLQSRVMKRLPKFSGLSKLRYLQINSPALLELAPRNFQELPNLEELHVFGSPRLVRLEAGLFRDLPRLELINITDCGIHWIHPRTMIDLPELKEISLVGNDIADAGMVGRACMDLPLLSVIRLDRNHINRLAEGSFVDLPLLNRLYLSRNLITEIFAGSFRHLPKLKTIDLNHNLIHRIHPEFVPRRSPNGLEEMWLINNDLSHIAEIRSVLEALPRLKFLDVSYNQLEEIPYGALRGHPTLERFHLDHNRLGFLQRETFTSMPALRELRLRNNSLSNLLEAPFWNLPALKGLDLSENYFRHIEPRLLANLPNLRHLDLSGNSIGLIEPESFRDTPALEHVNVSGNALSILHPLTFRHLTNLYELDVGWNRMLEIVPGLPRNIEHLHMPMNRIVALPSIASQDLALPVLRKLDLSANGIERIPPGALNELANLRKLILGYNALRVIEDGTFDGLSKLEHLDLRYNRLVTLHGRSFRSLRSLMDLNIRGNRLEVLRPDIFQENTRLQRLDFSRNNLAQIPHSTFVNTRDLRELYASHNTLTELPGSLHGLMALEILDLSFNKLNILSPETLSSLSSLLELRLVRNRIRELREGAFDGLPRLSIIDLENNDLRVIEKNAIRRLAELQAIRLGKNRIQTIPRGAFSELPLLQSAELQENHILEIDSKAFIGVPHLLFLNLSNNHLPSLEYAGLESLQSLEVLDLSNNRLARVSSDSLAAMEWLVELKMDNNRICAIQGSPFDKMPRLRVLSLRSNRMASVSENAFKRLRSNIAILDIDGNPLSCSCGMLWLRGWLQQASSEGPRCADGSLFKEIRLSRQDCQHERLIVSPVHPGCEAEIVNNVTPASGLNGATETVSLWMNLESSTTRPSVSHQNDYYEYLNDHSNVSTSLPIVSTEATIFQSVKIIQNSESTKYLNTKNATNQIKKNSSTIPPSPSSSGFTFFGVPLPNLNLNFWGNTGRKAERKETSGGRPGRGRYRVFPPTEPEIHRGGFIPLPRGQGGFVPMIDLPHFIYDQRQIRNDTPKDNLDQGTNYIRIQEERNLKHSNDTKSKLENNVSRTNKSLTGSKSKDELFISNIVGSSRFSNNLTENEPYSSLNLTKSIKSSLLSNETLRKRNDTFVPAELDRGNKLIMNMKERKMINDSRMEIASKIVWTTPRTDFGKMTFPSNKVIVTTINNNHENLNDFQMMTDKNIFRNTETMEAQKMETTMTMINPQNEATDNIRIVTTYYPSTSSSTTTMVTTMTAKTTTTNKLKDKIIGTSQANRKTEASALSTFLAPGGQISSSISTTGLRTLGRPTITKVPSPYLAETTDHSRNQDKENPIAGAVQRNIENIENTFSNNKETTTVYDNVKIIEDNRFNWYFQHYNDTNLEPFIGTVYSNSIKVSTYRSLLLFQLCFVIYI